MAESAAILDIGGLYADHGRWLRGWLQGRTRCGDRASDLAHDTFRRLLEARPTTAPAEPRRYLATIARRLLIDDIRRREVERAYLDALAHEDLVDTVTPERIAQAIELLDAVLRLLAGLPETTRRAFLMRRLDGLTHDEVARALRISERTVKRHMAHALAHIYALAYPDASA